MTAPALADPIAELDTRAQTWPERAKAFVVTTGEHYEAAGGLLVSIKELRAEIATTFDPMAKKAYDAHREVLAQRKKVEGPLEEAEGILKQAMLTYRAAEQRRIAEEQAAREAEARAAEEELRLAEAAALEEAGQPEQAAAVLDLPSVAPPVAVAPPTPAVRGVAVRKVWDAQVTDLKALVVAVAKGDVPLAALQANTAVIRAQARSLGAEMRWPGVRAFCTESIAAGRR